MQPKSIPVLIPAYQPGEHLLILVAQLTELGFRNIIVVNDGSGPQSTPWLEGIAGYENVRLLRHDVNRGKGAALKTGIAMALAEVEGCIGVVTADADGQHSPSDILRVAQRLA